MSRRLAISVAVLGAAVFGAVSSPRASHADSNDPAEKQERCATRVSIAVLGTSPSAAVLANADPQSQIDAMLQTPEFAERFARFVNSKFNSDPGTTSADDAPYHLSKYVLTNQKPWQDLFLGGYDVAAQGNGQNAAVTVTTNANGLGYFRSRAWMVRYAGNELAGKRLATAYRIMNNVVGLTLTATTNAPGADISANGRQAAACKSCHYDSWSALDHVADVLGVVQRQGNNVTFQPYTGAAVSLLGGAAMVQDDKQLVEALVKSENYPFNACRLAFAYLYGRAENVCEAPVFDKCVEAFKASGMIQSGLAAIAKDPSFCQ